MIAKKAQKTPKASAKAVKTKVVKTKAAKQKVAKKKTAAKPLSGKPASAAPVLLSGGNVEPNVFRRALNPD